MDAGTLVQWLKQPGDVLKRGDIIAVVDTNKGAIEIEVFEDGTLDRLLVTPGDKVPVGATLALIKSAGEAAQAIPVAPAIPVPAAAVPAAPTGAVRASPGARRAAEALGVDLRTVTGTAPGGAITQEDVQRAAAPRVTDKTAAMRAAIAAAMSRSKREIPHLYLSSTIEMTRVLAWLTKENKLRSVTQRLLPIAVLIKAVARAAGDVPGLNGFWVEGSFRPAAGIHIGCAIALRDGGLVAPAIHDAEGKTVDVVMTELMDLVARARAGTLRSSELADPTMTVTNLGDLGVESAFAVIYPPQVAIVGFGRMVQRAWVVDGRIEPRTVLTATLSADHRAVDGRRAGRFLSAIERRLQAPEEL